MPHLADAIRRAPAAEIVRDPTGAAVDLRLEDGLFYKGDGRAVADAQVRAFAEQPNRVIGAPLFENPMTEVESDALQRDILAGARDGGIRFFKTPRERHGYFLICFGVGAGHHLRPLVEATGCATLIVVEPSPAVLAASLDIVDWQACVPRPDGPAGARPGQLVVVMQPDPDTAMIAVREAMRAINVAAIDGFSFFRHDERKFFQDMIARIRADAGAGVNMFANLGSFVDETVMIRNAYRNLRTEGGRLFRPGVAAGLGLPAFIIASGPSLDRSLPVLKKIKDRAVVISCGTALRPLLNAGIAPDMHIDIENVNVAQVLDDIRALHDIRPIPLIGAVSIDAAAVEAFGRTVYFFRPAQSPFALFGPSTGAALPDAEPSVANAAAAFVVEAGFPAVYLFGVDLGARADAGHHHAADTYHDQEGAFVVADDYRFDLTVPGNFGAECRTSGFLSSSRDSLALLAMRTPPETRLFNCSDGALIAGFQPLEPERLNPAAPAVSPADAAARILDACPAADPAVIERLWDKPALLAAAAKVFDALHTAVKNARGPAVARHLTDALAAAVAKAGARPPGADADAARTNMARTMLQGSVVKMAVVAAHYLDRAASPADLEKLAAVVGDALGRRIDALEAALATIVEKPETPIEDYAVTEVIRKGADEIMAGLYLPPPSRMAPCPCGSGRKYKHCHGR